MEINGTYTDKLTFHHIKDDLYLCTESNRHMRYNHIKQLQNMARERGKDQLISSEKNNHGYPKSIIILETTEQQTIKTKDNE
jgi:hypothetical protein